MEREREWVAPAPERHDPACAARDERTALEGWLGYHRQTLLVKCAGLGAEDLKRRAVPPSRLALLGLVRHMTEVERWWFRNVAMGEPYHRDPANRDRCFEDLDDADAPADLLAFEEECRAATRGVGSMGLTERAAIEWPPGTTPDLRWIYLHMIEEYARHNGHADLIREAIDGARGD